MSTTHFSAPGFYRIEVEGLLPSSWFERLGEMKVLPPPKKNMSNVTIMQGRVADQADLSGILNSLYELHMPILNVKFMGSKLLKRESDI